MSERSEWRCDGCGCRTNVDGNVEAQTLRTRLAAVEAERDEAWAALMTDALPVPAEDYPLARRLREERDHYRGLVTEADTTRRDWEVRAAESYKAGRAAGLREAAGECTALAYVAEDLGWVNGAAECSRRILALLGPGEVGGG